MHSDAQQSVRNFIRKNFVLDDKIPLSDSDSLIGTGIVDSTGILEIINYVEETFALHCEDNELVAENFDSVEKIAAYIGRKTTPAA